tara:strand:+ start:229 stop:483 length:255 start_codon:yes stop_codon:yes gene_type:complete
VNRTFYYDPSHAWLKVPIEDVGKYNIKDITTYSYQDGSFFYLEEDCDAPLYINAVREAGHHLTITEREDTIGIRNLQPYGGELV